MQEKIQGFPLSPQQKRLWLVQQGGNFYRNQCGILIEGNLQVDILKQALDKIIARNEVLRTSFYRQPGLKIPIQVINNHTNVFLNEYDLESQSPHNIEIETLFDKIRQESSKLGENHLLKIVLVNFSANKYILFINLPSLCTDFKTFKNIVTEISQYYTACLQNIEIEIDEEPLQYADIATWQNELLEAEETTTRTKYWQKVDFSTLDNLKLAFENCFSEESEFEPQVISLAIPKNLLTKIEEIIQKSQVSIDIFFLTCWQILLWRLTGQSKLIIGVGCDGRSYEELKTALGLFSKYLPLVSDLKDNYTFSDRLVQVKELTDETLKWQDSFSWNVFAKTAKDNIEELVLPFCYEFEETVTNYSAHQVAFSIYQSYVCFDRFKLKLSCVRRQNDLVQVEFHYDAKHFHKEDIQRLASQWQSLLLSVIDNPSVEISRLDILSEQEREQLLIAFNNTQTSELQYKCIHHWFEAQCDRTSDNIAVIYQNQQLTYQELNTRANQLAHYLQQLGIKPDVMVGICLERSPLMLIALLGILKAGGAYIPIDPSYPSERKAFIINDSQIPILLTQQRLMADFATNEIKAICIDSDWQAISQQKIENLITTTTELNLAYIIYTSGSTGKPKGTLIPHQGLVNYLTWATQRYAVEQGVGTVVHSPLGFDLTITSLLSPLLVGRTAELLPEEQGIETLSQALKKSSNLSLVKITPAHLDLLKQQLSQEEIANKTRAFIIGGENLLAESITFWQDVAPDTMLINEYGPTETVVGCCIYEVPVGKYTLGSIPIGKPIANTQLYILDKYLQPVPTGVVGELHIGGLGLARGYLNQPELTALKFIPNPFSKQEGDRLYKTGDLVRFLASGDIEYIGRIDNQIKIRGFRVELGEIEGVINQHPSVSASVAIVREDKPGNQNLIAYITLHSDKTLTISELRRFLQNKLLDHMMPTAFMILEAFPLTSNGKVDRRALPIPNGLRPELEVAYAVPQTEIEKTIASVWQQALNLEKIGIHDNFFEIGGHSLLLVTVHSQLQEILKAELSTLDLFRYPTINSLAEYLSSSANKTVPLQDSDIETEKILSGKAQQRKRLQKIKLFENN
ncbi:MAG: amino acid adenylation domain-containing protein [Nostoc sp. ChiSLP02]|nr:amino acid adenylation domain-containing protein [Nostoc sp. DedSLP05]MDZ8102882.1 amino acid adenylation domain-containing protein [Nostoc sp. DedSLP01]MDZ8184107.1 amino acid adenylation domain-containing protein [Nostoc sp. ChiSLP02]